MTTAPLPSHERRPTVYLDGEELVFDGFRESEPDLVALVRESSEPEATAHRVLAMGARTLRLVQAGLDSAVVEREFEAMKGALARTLDEFNGRIDASAAKLLGEEEGELARSLKSWQSEVEKLLGETFGETSTKSVLVKLDALLKQARAEQAQVIGKLINPHDPASPLANWRAEIERLLNEQAEQTRKLIQGLSEKLAAADAKAQIFQLTTAKGLAFEEEVLEALVRIAGPHGDVPAAVGTMSGASGSKTGDFVVTLNPAATNGRNICYAVEAKDRKLSLRAALDELEKAMANRDALASILVFKSPECCPAPDLFTPYDNKALVVLEDGDDQALRLACLWARWVVSRQLSEESGTIDVSRIEELIQGARRSLASVTAIRSSHAKAKKGIEGAADAVESLVGELERALNAISTELNQTGESQADLTFRQGVR